MPGELSQTAQQQALNFSFGRSLDVTPPFAVYLALCTGPLTDALSVAAVAALEVTTTGYARQSVTWSSATAANPSVIANSGTITVGPFAVDMAVPAVYAALLTASTGTGGSYRAWWQLDAPMQALAGQSLQVSAGNLSMSLT